jgi:signal transduction histidine kinase
MIGESLAYAEDETRRANRILDGLMKFTRADPSPTEVIDLTEQVRRSSATLRAMVEKQGITLRTALPDTLQLALADGDQLHEVLLNLLRNAIHAVVACPRKEILVSLTEENGENVIIVEDSGTGMPPEVMRRIFEPFFTTKPIGQGTGLGLAVCHGIILNHRGRIEVTSEPGQGTRFAIRLPLVEETGVKAA